MDNQSAVTQEGFTTLEEHNSKEENKQLTLFNLQNLTVTNSKSLEELQKQLKTAKEMYEDTFKNDASYKEAADKVKGVDLERKQVKNRIEQQPSVIAQKEKLRELKNEIKEKKAAISDYATEVVRMSGAREFEKDGETYDIVTVAKLVKRKQ